MKKAFCDKGFTLIEIVISLGLIAIALLSVFRLQAYNLDLQSEAKFITMSTQLAMDRISYIRSLSTTGRNSFSGDFGDRFPEFRYSGEISGTAEMGFYKAVVEVTAGEGTGRRSFISETYLYETVR